MSSDLGSLWGTTALPMWSEYRNVGTGGNTLIFFFLNQEIQVCGTQATLAHPVPRAGSINQVLHFPAKPRCSLRIYPSTFRNAAASMHAAMPAEIKPHPWEGSQKPEAGLHSHGSPADLPGPECKVMSPASQGPSSSSTGGSGAAGSPRPIFWKCHLGPTCPPWIKPPEPFWVNTG